jgi:hypothetical protein
MRSIYLQSFMLIPLILLELCPGQSSKCKNKQRGIIQKIGKAELRFLCTAHLLNEIYLPTKFHVDTSCCYVPDKKRGQTDGRTDGGTARRTDKAATICSPEIFSGSIIKAGNIGHFTQLNWIFQ